MKRVLVGGMHHESNTFNPILTGRDDIRVLRGPEIFRQIGEGSIYGSIATLQAAGYEVVPTLIARAVPNGEWERPYYEELRKELLDGIRNAGHLDAICLSLHGSMRVQGIGEAEGDILQAVRALYPDIPLFSSLDMHATVTRRMISYVDGFVGYKCAPHTDTFETGQHAARMVIKTLEQNVQAKMAVCRVPMLIAGEQSETSVEPMLSLMKTLRELEKQPKIMALSYLLGFPWADCEENGVVALVVTEDDQELADTTASMLARLFWDTREKFGFYNETHDPAKALSICLAQARDTFPVVISDSGDNPTAGSSGDVTNFLRMILADNEASSLQPPLIYQCFYDPIIVEKAIQVGVGGTMTADLGALYDKEKSRPIHATMVVESIVRDWVGAPGTDMALVHMGGVDVVVTSRHVGAYDPDMMRALGVVPEERKIIVVKLGYLEPEIRAISRYSVMALTDGSSNEILTDLPYQYIERPVFPLDTDFEPTFEILKKRDHCS